MRIRMTNRAFRGAANVLPDEVAKWEAAGWVADRKTTGKPAKEKETEE